MNILEQLTIAFTSNLTLIIISIAVVIILQSAMDAYSILKREEAKSINKFTFTSPMNETITIDSTKPLEIIQLRSLISTCNNQEVKVPQLAGRFVKQAN